MSILNVQGSGVELSIDGTPVAEPFQTTLYVWSTGTEDMPTSAFDNAVPITFTLDRPMLGKVETVETPGSTVATALDDDRTLLFGPGLVRKDYRGSWIFVTEGISTIRASQALYNATLQSAAHAEKSDSLREKIGALFGVLAVLTAFVVVIAAVVSSSSPVVRDVVSNWIGPAFLAIGLLLGGLIALFSVPTRWDRAQRKRGASRFAKYNGDPFNPQERYHST